MNKNIFVFVVCGTRTHIDTLHYSLLALKKVSKNEIIVISDSSRNEIPVMHENYIDIATPKELNHHQASIYLKTSLHKLLPSGNNYCYLDTDVVAVNEKADLIFNHFTAPITFAPDHCVLDEFSPSAVNCNCAIEFATWQKELKQLFHEHKDLIRQPRVPENFEKKQKLLQRLEKVKKNKWGYRLLSLRFNLARNTFKLDADTFLDKKKHYWHDKEGNPVLYENEEQFLFEETIEHKSSFRCDRTDFKTWTIGDKNVFDCRCNHLSEAIKEIFDIEISDTQWQHWNGGVFLFNDSSHEFLEEWHHKTSKIFSLAHWKTRDQGTLIATVWQFGLQNHPTLPFQFNLIADYQNLNMQHKGKLRFAIKNVTDEIHPNMVHIYHHWGDKLWDVWQAVEKATGIETDADGQTINSLWIGKTLSQLELLTIHSFRALGYRFKLWVYEPVETVLPNDVIIGDASTIIPSDKIFAYRNKNTFGHGKGSYAGFSDIFRYKLLYEKGGWWVDMDVTCLHPFNFELPYVFRSHHDLSVVGNVMKCPKGSKLMKQCYEEAVDSVNEYNTDWLKPIAILNKHVAALQLKNYIQYDISNEDKWQSTNRFIWHKDTLPMQWHFVHWQNEEWRKNAVEKTDFYYRSALASLMAQYQLYHMPDSRLGKLINAVRHSSYFRVLENLFLADI